jgi:hypothetical protein
MPPLHFLVIACIVSPAFVAHCQSAEPTAVIDTTAGRITCTLLTHARPVTTAHFIGLAQGTELWTAPNGSAGGGKPFYEGTRIYPTAPASPPTPVPHLPSSLGAQSSPSKRPGPALRPPRPSRHDRQRRQCWTLTFPDYRSREHQGGRPRGGLCSAWRRLRPIGRRAGPLAAKHRQSPCHSGCHQSHCHRPGRTAAPSASAAGRSRNHSASATDRSPGAAVGPGTDRP